MNKILFFLIVFIGAVYPQTIPFNKFDSTKIDVGTMYIYEYSRNKENFEPTSEIYIYIKTLNDIEVLVKRNKNTTISYIRKYMINWNYMMLSKSEWQFLGDRQSMPSNTTYSSTTIIDFEKKRVIYKGINKIEDGFKNTNNISEFESIPTYFYRKTDLLPLWFSLRFYPLGKKDISVNHNAHGYDTDFSIKYIGKEKVETTFGKVLCHKFELFPQMSFFMKLFYSPEKAWIWLSAEDNYRYMVKYRNNNERSTFTQNMEYRLAERKQLTLEEWESFKETNRPKK